MENPVLIDSKRRLIVFFVASSALHALTVVLIFVALWWIGKPNTTPKTARARTTAIEFEIPSAGEGAAQARPKDVAARYPKTSGTGNSQQETLIKNLTQQSYSSARNAAESEQGTGRVRSGSSDEGGYGLKDDPSVAWGAGSGTFQRIQDLGLMSKFQDKVDAMLFYPGILARRKMSGVVNTRIVLDAEGNCDWDRTRIESANPYFRVYILHMLKNVCSENFKAQIGSRQMTNIDMSFQFEISEDVTSKELIDRNQKVVGNVLLFYRHARHSVAEWHLGPFTGVFPLPFINLDFDWIQENFDKYINGEDPLDDFRDS